MSRKPVVALGKVMIVQMLQNWFTGIPNPSQSSRLRMRLPDFYRMSKVGSIRRLFLPSFLGISSSKRLVPDPILGVEEARCSIGDSNGVVQVVQNWFTGIL